MIIDLSGPKGNVFYLMGMLQRYVPQDQLSAVLEDMRSKDYKHALDVFEQHVPEVTFLNDPRS